MTDSAMTKRFTAEDGLRLQQRNLELEGELEQSRAECERLRKALNLCVTDRPWAQTIGAQNRIGTINTIASAAIAQQEKGDE